MYKVSTTYLLFTNEPSNDFRHEKVRKCWKVRHEAAQVLFAQVNVLLILADLETWRGFERL